MDKNLLYNLIENLPNLKFTGGVEDTRVTDAEDTLHLKFALDYVEYLRKFGQIEATGIELTGLSDKWTTSVVNATNTLRKVTSIPEDMYVIEDLEIDGIEYLQNSLGKVFQFNGGTKLSLYANSLSDYIIKSQK